MCSHRMPIRSLDVERSHSEITDVTEICQNRPKSRFRSKSPDFVRFECAKPLQMFSTSTALRVERSVRLLDHYSRRNTRKSIKIEQNPVEKVYKIRKISPEIGFLDSHSWGRPQPLQGWF